MSGASRSAPSNTAPDAVGRPGARLVEALARLLPLFAIAAGVLLLGATLAVAGDTLGFDFRAYWAAGSRVLAGQAAYDTSYTAAGGFGLFYYPPTFIPLVLPFALLPETLAVWAWTAILVAAMVGASRRCRSRLGCAGWWGSSRRPRGPSCTRSSWGR